MAHFELKMVQLDRMFQFAAGPHVSHDAWMHSMALFEAGERRPLVWRFGVVAKIKFGGSGLTRLPGKEKEARDLLSSHGDQRKCDEQMKAFEPWSHFTIFFEFSHDFWSTFHDCFPCL